MTADVIQQYEAALQRLINNQPASSGMKISRDSVGKAALQKSSPSAKNPRPRVRAPENNAQRVEIVRDDANS
ncbi:MULTISPECIES: hypothetical protein [Pseudomonas syringae group]|uniref:hypothetical protein n=1 Tax=Pseudomonas syringae group TaxID=136849 RepID=UPI00118731F4|nr:MULTISPECIES: hypothetical protein [Pseudomonas syringae group]MCI3911837.1 hypothetical protein [Pseudomonas viridiflava]MCK9730291.1 hypothetical protein [Pseudomonas syringae pv. syringae]